VTQQETIWNESPSLKSYTLANFRDLPQIQNFSEQTQFEMEVVGNVLPFKANNYVVEQLIDWNNIPNDPMYVLTFPQKGMLKAEHFEKMSTTLKNNSDKKEIANVANEIRLQLNPHPAGQMELNVPTLKDGTKLYGMQHKYKKSNLSCIL
jgi:L-lysine 2,3-aminomutase